jgi:hypothetical protein
MLNSLTKLVDGTGNIVVKISGLLMTVAFIAFLLAIISYIWKRQQGNTDGLKQAGNMLFGSAFALFVMVAVWGIAYFLSQNLGVAIGGCAPKPSSIPGQVVVDNCKTGSTSGSGTTNPSTLPASRPSCSTMTNTQCASVSYCKVDALSRCVNT